MNTNNFSIDSLTPVHQGSVKSIRKGLDDGSLIFEYSDKYSIYDWGEMPDKLAGKGTALAVMADLFFRFLGNGINWIDWQLPDFVNIHIQEKLYRSKTYEILKSKGLHHHSQGLVDKLLNPLSPGASSRFLKVKKVAVVRPIEKNGDWDYEPFSRKPTNTLVPLEVIFRMGVPTGSSLVDRLKNDSRYLEELGFKSAPHIGDKFDRPIIEFSTKLEPIDRYLSYEEAQKIAGLTENEFNELINLTQLLSLRLYSMTQTLGLELWDGKFEFAFDDNNRNDRGFILIDSIGLDELRILQGNGHLSKEILRQFYNDTDWYREIGQAKVIWGNEWKRYCVDELKISPKQLDQETKKLAEDLYGSFTNSLASLFGLPKVFKNLQGINEWNQKIH